jgi:hypothetical protein
MFGSRASSGTRSQIAVPRFVGGSMLTLSNCVINLAPDIYRCPTGALTLILVP